MTKVIPPPLSLSFSRPSFPFSLSLSLSTCTRGRCSKSNKVISTMMSLLGGTPTHVKSGGSTFG